MKAYRSKPESETQRWWRHLLKRANKATADESVIADKDRQILLDVVQPNMLNTLLEAGQAWIRLADFLEKLFKQQENEASPDGAA